MTRSRAVVEAARTLGNPPLPNSLFVYSLTCYALHMHTSSASFPDFTSLSIPCPLVSHLPIILTTPPSDLSSLAIQSANLGPPHPYNLRPHFAHPPECSVSSRLGLASPSCTPKSTIGRKSHMSKAMSGLKWHQANNCLLIRYLEH